MSQDISNAPPWSFDPDLSEERLRTIERITARVHRDALEFHQPGLGETNLSLGVRRYERTVHSLREAAEFLDWLSVSTSNNECVLRIGDAVVKFSYDDPLRPRAKHVERHQLEAQLLQGSFFQTASFAGIQKQVPFGAVWRIFIEASDGDRGSRITVSLYDPMTRQAIAPWTVPSDSPDIGNVLVPGHESPPPEIIDLDTVSTAEETGDATD